MRSLLCELNLSYLDDTRRGAHVYLRSPGGSSARGHDVADGRFEIRFTDEFFSDVGEKYPDIYLKIFDPSGSRELLSTERAVRWNADAIEHFAIEIPRRLANEGGGSAA